MRLLKKVWATEQGRGLLSISMESSDTNIPITIKEHKFPTNPTPEYPLRHTVNFGLLTEEDVNMLAQLLDQYRTDK